MARIIYDEEYIPIEMCLSCDRSYTEDLWNEFCCDEKVCTKRKQLFDKIKEYMYEKYSHALERSDQTWVNQETEVGYWVQGYKRCYEDLMKFLEGV